MQLVHGEYVKWAKRSDMPGLRVGMSGGPWPTASGGDRIMQFLGPPGRVALTVGLRGGVDTPDVWAERPPLAPAALVLHGVLDGDALAALTAQLDDGPHRASALRSVREDLDAAVMRAFDPLDLHTDVHVCRSFPGGCSMAGDPTPYTAAGPQGSGWWTAVRLVVPLPGAGDATWTLRSPGRDEPLHGAGDIGVAGPGTVVDVHHTAGPPRPWLTCRTALRFPQRHLGPPVHVLVG